MTDHLQNKTLKKMYEIFDYIEVCIEEKELTSDARHDIEMMFNEVYNLGFDEGIREIANG